VDKADSGSYSMPGFGITIAERSDSDTTVS
jgi:hypothetical protein